MKRWTGFWQRVPRLRVTLVMPGRETNPLAEKIMEALHCALQTASDATDNARSANESLGDALKLIAELQGQLDPAREELIAYHASCMEPDAQVAELERIEAKTDERE